MPRTRVKICGLTRPEDAYAAVDAGVDAIGLVFYPPSPRAVDWVWAARLTRGLPPFVTVVGLFVDPSMEEVEQVLNNTRIDLLQFHGSESDAFCGRFGKPYMKAIRMKPGLDLMVEISRYPGSSGILLDAWHPGEQGGTGETFDWKRVPAELKSSIVLAGGLTVSNVSLALAEVQPYAVDVSSGVEEKKGIKDAAKMTAFLKEVEDYDNRIRRVKTL